MRPATWRGNEPRPPASTGGRGRRRCAPAPRSAERRRRAGSTATIASAAFGRYQPLMISVPGTTSKRDNIGCDRGQSFAYSPSDTSRNPFAIKGHSVIRGASQASAARSAASASASASVLAAGVCVHRGADAEADDVDVPAAELLGAFDRLVGERRGRGQVAAPQFDQRGVSRRRPSCCTRRRVRRIGRGPRSFACGPRRADPCRPG